MACYRNGGCGPYEMRSCNECPASKPEYAQKNVTPNKTEKVDKKEPIKVKIFVNDKGVRCVMVNKNIDLDVEVVDESSFSEQEIDAYINQLCGDGMTFLNEENITHKESL